MSGYLVPLRLQVGCINQFVIEYDGAKEYRFINILYMKIVISPSKRLDFTSKIPFTDFTEPQFISKSKLLIDVLKQMKPVDIAAFMGISGKLAEINFDRFQQWRMPFTPSNARQAIYAFDGDVYDGLDVRTLNEEQVDYLKNRLRILSGLYGLLRPFDLIQPYRLEMGRKLVVGDNNNLYQFWGSAITDALNLEFLLDENPTLINLASEEYFKSVIQNKLNARVITPVFMEEREGKPRMIALMAKRARGMMVRFLAEQKIVDVEDIKTFDYNGYSYNADLSFQDRWVFVR